jgi:hypothetical protein
MQAPFTDSEKEYLSRGVLWRVMVDERVNKLGERLRWANILVNPDAIETILRHYGQFGATTGATRFARLEPGKNWRRHLKDIGLWMELKELGELDDEEWEEGDPVEEGNNHESEAEKVEKDSRRGFRIRRRIR